MTRSCPGTCPTPGPLGRRPRVDVSWYDSVAFAAPLYRMAAGQGAGQPAETGRDHGLPAPADGKPNGKYAARGGARVSEAEFRARVFPMPEGVTAYAWVDGPASADGQLRQIGLLKPNPLGLHDILGNAAEWVLDFL